MKKLYGLLLLGVLFACQPSKDEICKDIDGGIRTYFEDLAFKENSEIKIYDLKTVDYRMVGEGAVDSMNLNHYAMMQDRYFQKGVAIRKQVQADMARYKLLKELDMELPVGWETNVKSDLDKSKSLIDSSHYFMDMDSITRERIESRSAFKPLYYKTRTFMKATISKTNILDTLEMIVDKNYKVISPTR